VLVVCYNGVCGYRGEPGAAAHLRAGGGVL